MAMLDTEGSSLPVGSQPMLADGLRAGIQSPSIK